MGKGLFDKKSCLRFKLVHRSVLDEDADAVVAGDREFVPLDSKSSARMDVLREGMAPRRVTFADECADEDGLGGTVPVDPEAAVAAHAGEAAKYGVFFDDRTYDYTRHLRTIGAEPGGVFVPSAVEGSDAVESDTPPDVAHDPRLAFDDDALAEVMDALDDDAYVDAEGFADDLVVSMDRTYTAVLCSADEYGSEDSAGDSEESLVYGCAPSVACTSRTLAPSTFAPSLAATTTLENRFDAVLRLYDSDDGADADIRGLASDSDGDDNDTALLRALGEFESNEREYMLPDAAARRRAAVELLTNVRSDLGPVPASVLERFAHGSSTAESSAESSTESSTESVAYDVQSIIMSRTCGEYVPALIRDATRSARKGTVGDEIRVCPRTGMPLEDSLSSDDEEESDMPRENRGVARPRGESAEDKRARKAAVRAERRNARVSKKDARVRSSARV